MYPMNSSPYDAAAVQPSSLYLFINTFLKYKIGSGGSGGLRVLRRFAKTFVRDSDL